MLIVFTTAFAMMVIGLGFIIFFVLFTSRQNLENIQYQESSIARRLGENISFIEDGIISIRHNSQIKEFLSSELVTYKDVETQLAYSIDIFSERNRNDSSQPFVSRVYLYNQNDSFINIDYYPETVQSAEQSNELFLETKKRFQNANGNYGVFPGSSDNSRIMVVELFDDDMVDMGICALEFNLATIEEIFSPIGIYRNHSWQVGFRPYGKEAQILVKNNDSGDTQGDNDSNIYLCSDYSLGLFSEIAVDRSNIYYNLGGLAISLLVLSGLLLILMAVRIVFLIREVYEKELVATKTQVKYLQSQLNPHFQYNVIAMLSIRAKSLGDESLYQSLRAFSNLAKGKIFREGEIYISLCEELELVRFYLQLQKDRFGERLNYEIDYDDVELGSVMIPKLIIEPLVENAVEHGIEPKEEGGKVSIVADKKDEELYIVIEDDGVGFNSNLTSVHTGTSLENTKRLLQVMYPDRHQISIKSGETDGTRIEIRIPVKHD